MAAQSEIIGNLQISTLGLATYLPDGSRMQVVMPATHGHEAHGIPEHKIVLFWESVKFEGPNSAKEGQRSLARRALEIREVGHTGPTPHSRTRCLTSAMRSTTRSIARSCRSDRRRRWRRA